MKLKNDIYYYSLDPFVTKHFGRGFTCCTYIIKQTEDELWLIDTGSSNFGIFHRLLKRIKNDGLNPKNVKKIFITHAHPDHITAIKNWKKLCNPNIYLSDYTAHVLRKGNKQFFNQIKEELQDLWAAIFPAPSEIVKLVLRLKMGKIPEIPNKIPLTILNDHEKIVGEKYSLHVNLTPGHSPGHFSYYIPEQKILFSGDLFGLYKGAKPVLNLPHASFADYLYSLDKLSNMDINHIYAGHMPESKVQTYSTKESCAQLITHTKHNLQTAITYISSIFQEFSLSNPDYGKLTQSIFKNDNILNNLDSTLWDSFEKKMMIYVFSKNFNTT